MQTHPERLDTRNFDHRPEQVANLLACDWGPWVEELSAVTRRQLAGVLSLVRDEVLGEELNPDGFVHDGGQPPQGPSQWWDETYTVGHYGRPGLCEQVLAAAGLLQRLSGWCAAVEGMPLDVGGIGWCANRVLAEVGDPDEEVVALHAPGGTIWQLLAEDANPLAALGNCDDHELEALFAHCVIDAAMLVLRLGLEGAARLVDELAEGLL